MPLLDCEITTPKAVHLNLMLANGKSVNVPQGVTMRYQLTGDELGRVEAALQSGLRIAKMNGALDAEVLGGGVRVLTPGYGDVPKGSKKALAMDPVTEPEVVEKKPAKPAKK